MKTFSLFLLCTLSMTAGAAIEKDAGDTLVQTENDLLLNRFEIGGNLGLQFGSYTIIDISPLFGYKISRHFTAGVGFSYMYFNDRQYLTSTTIWGGRTFGRYYIVDNIFLHAEYELLNGDWLYDGKRFNIVSLFGGGGFSQRLGGNSFFTLMILWNFNDSMYSPYINPVLRGGFSVGL